MMIVILILLVNITMIFGYHCNSNSNCMIGFASRNVSLKSLASSTSSLKYKSTTILCSTKSIQPSSSSSSTTTTTTTRSTSLSLSSLLSLITKNITKIIPITLVIVSLLSLGKFVLSTIDIKTMFENAIKRIEGLGPLGYLYFSGIYILCEILMIPTLPLVTSSGYLFNLIPGVLICLSSSTIAAGISFLLGKNILKKWMQKLIEGSSKWKTIDKAISKQGFKVILLLRLSPFFPFAIANYLYGLTSVDFASYLAATFMGYIPGTLGMVYAGYTSKVMTGSGGNKLPLYAYIAIGLAILLIGKQFATIATNMIKELENDK